ncbi:zinc metalloproteinase-disintegrin-like NaMP isoform X2 [Glandiceps talaboti]
MDNFLSIFIVLVSSCVVYGNLFDLFDGTSPSLKKQLQKLQHYEVFTPVRLEGRQKRDLSTKIQDGHLEEASFSFEAFGKDFILDVYLNEVLFPEGFVERYYLEDGTPVVKRPNTTHQHCYYYGEVRDSNISTVALSTCDGLSGVISDGSDTYYVEPLQDSQSNQHLIYKSHDAKRPHGSTCGHRNNAFSSIYGDDVRKLSQLKRVRRDVHTETKYIELYIVSDHSEYNFMLGNIDSVRKRTKEIANLIDTYYRPLNVRVALIGLEVWSNGDMIEVSSNPMTTMDNFQTWRKDDLLPSFYNDNAQLLTGRTFEGSTVGMASLGGMCSSERSAGVNEDHGLHPADVASTMTHEIGHNIGLVHDSDDRNCVCTAPPREGCIMEAASGSIPPTVWSSCSHDDLTEALEKGLGACLFDYPSIIYGGPICGNGFTESGEECDCGKPEDCENVCCNAHNCTLQLNATCAEGECCEDCQLKEAGTVCRDVVNECDLPEYCMGISPECPGNVYRQNGELCAKTKDAYCYYGACVTHDRQCNELWGEDGASSIDYCYEDTNKRGDQLGNCGEVEGVFIPCALEDVMCGRLMCEKGTDYPVKGALSLTRVSFVYVDGQPHECKAASVDLGSDVPDPGLVLSGTKCGEKMMCYDYECKSFDEIGIKNCAYNCSNNGVCNSNNHCHCDKNWAPPYCNTPGFGGSKDSGPIRPPVEDTGSSGTVIVIIVMCLVVIPCVLVTAICLLYHRNKMKAWWLSKKYKQTSVQSNGMETKSTPDVVKTHQLTVTTKPQPLPKTKPKPAVKTQNRPIHRVPYTGNFDRRSLERKSAERNPQFTEINLNDDRHNAIAPPPPRPLIPPAASKPKPTPPPKPGRSIPTPNKPETPSRPNSLPLRPVAPRRAPNQPRRPIVPKKPNTNPTVC